VQPAREVRKGDFVAAFGGPAMAPARRDPNIDYMLNPNVEQFFVHVPEEYTGDTAYGLIVFVDADSDSRQLPAGWQTLLDSRKLLYIAPQNAGNDQDTSRRMGLAVLGALEMMKHYRIDPHRVYVAGFSGGARMAGLLGFFQADLFRGTIQNCGADFYKAVPVVEATSTVDTAGNPYGLFQASDDEIASARRVRFALITGSRDFRHGNILDLYNGGFAHEGFKAKLFDVRGMAHDIADESTLSNVLDFLEAND
jgi:dienelactone hydrolase